MKNRSLLALVLPLAAALAPTATATAQTPHHLVGITQLTPALRHTSHQNCQTLNQCALPGMPSSALLPAFAGGTGWDPVRSGAWVSNGTALAKFDDQCNVQCPPMPIPSLGPNAFVTGIEVVVGKDEVWLIDSLGILHFYTNTCPPQLIGTCNTGLAPTPIGQVTTGLAVDEGSGYAFISYPAMPVGPNQIAVMPLFALCQITGTVNVPPCTTAVPRPILGLACDWGSNTLYTTDGFSTSAINYTPGAVTVFFNGINCCPPAVVNEPMVGLAVRPGRATSSGQPCNNGACAPCPMNHSLRNDPLLGNAQFQLGLDQAQGNVFAFCLLGAGPCMNVGIVTPPLCGPLRTLPYIGSLGPNITPASPAFCSSSTSFSLPLPVAPGLAGQVFSSQCLSICFNSSGGFGTALSNCLSWQMQGQ